MPAAWPAGTLPLRFGVQVGCLAASSAAFLTSHVLVWAIAFSSGRVPTLFSTQTCHGLLADLLAAWLGLEVGCRVQRRAGGNPRCRGRPVHAFRGDEAGPRRAGERVSECQSGCCGGQQEGACLSPDCSCWCTQPRSAGKLGNPLGCQTTMLANPGVWSTSVHKCS